MRKLTLIATVAILVLALTSAALAAFSQSASVTLTGHKAGQSTGITSNIHSSDPTAPGAKPKSATKLVITFPAGTRFNLTTPLVTRCTLTDKQLTTPFGPVCPRRSQIGTGTAVANVNPIQLAVKASVKVYLGKGNIVMVALPSLPGAAPIIIHASASGSNLSIPVPHPWLGKSKGFPGVEVVLVSLKLNVPVLGSGHNALVTAGKCTAHKFVVKSRFTYVDHKTLSFRSSSHCS